jgi:DNA replication protein DnaC
MNTPDTPYQPSEAVQDRRLSKWILPLYRNSDRDMMHAKNKKVLGCIDSYDTQEADGLYLSGKPGTCKTRAVVAILEKFCRENISIAFVPSTRLAELFRFQFKDDEYEKPMSVLGGRWDQLSTGQQSRNILHEIASAGVLVIDDIGKEKATARYETEILALLEHRTGSFLTTLYTSNFAPIDLVLRFSEDQGSAIIRRIVEFSKCVAF